MKADDNIDALIEQYLLGKFSDEEKITFEERMLHDVELAEEVQINRQLFHYLGSNTQSSESITEHLYGGDEYRQYFQSAEGKKDYAQILNAGKVFQKYSLGIWQPRNRLFIAVAASLFLVLVSILLWIPMSNKDSKDLYQAYRADWENLPSLTMRSEEDFFYSEIESNFRKRAYDQVVESLTIINPDSLTPDMLLYLGISYLELDQMEMAMKSFNLIRDRDYLDHDKAYWYRALAFLKQGDLRLCREELSVIINNPGYFNHTKAIELLKELE